MMLHWQVIFASLAVEMIAVALLTFSVVPVAVKKALWNLSANSTFKQATNVYLAIVSLLFLETIFEILYGKSPIAAVNSANELAHEEFHHYESELLQHRTNALGALVSIFLLLVFDRLCTITRENFKFQSDSEILKKQASNMSTEYMRLLSESDKSKGSNSGTSIRFVNMSQKFDEEDDTVKQNKDLKEKIKELTKQLEKSTNDVNAIQKQAQNQQESYDKLLQENKSLNNKLKDYELIFGDAQKKKV